MVYWRYKMHRVQMYFTEITELLMNCHPHFVLCCVVSLCTEMVSMLCRQRTYYIVVCVWKAVCVLRWSLFCVCVYVCVCVCVCVYVCCV